MWKEMIYDKASQADGCEMQVRLKVGDRPSYSRS
jgi:hypothetical protein